MAAPKLPVNQLIADSTISHAVDLHLYANHLVRRLVAILNRTDADLAAQLSEALDQIDSSFTVDRLDSLLHSIRGLNSAAYAQLEQELTTQLRDLTSYELGYQAQLFSTTLPPQAIASIGLNTVSTDQVYAAAMARPFQGRLLKEWAATLEEQRALRIRDAVRIGFTANEPIQDIVRRIRGTRSAGYSDGLLEIDRRNAEAVVRTAVSHTAAYAREKYYDENADLIKALEWTATLDMRTSEMCRIRDGKRYTADGKHKPIGHSIPWDAGPGALHWQCRSVASPIMKSWAELGIPLEEVPSGSRASMDGQVPAEQTYGAWLKRQSAARQDEVLGPTRGALLRRGDLSFDRFANNKGRWLTLDELRERDAAAFEKAGV